MSDEVADALAATREYIETFGLWKGTLMGPDNKACVMGALTCVTGLLQRQPGMPQTAVFRSEVGAGAVVAISRALRAEGIKRSIPDWNDLESTTQQEVLDLLAKAEKIERNGGVNPDE
jgi:hypothetical protein